MAEDEVTSVGTDREREREFISQINGGLPDKAHRAGVRLSERNRKLIEETRYGISKTNDQLFVTRMMNVSKNEQQMLRGG